MRRAYKYRLVPTKTQAILLAEQVETLRHVYNDALSQRKDAWELFGVSSYWQDQVKQWQARRSIDIQTTEGPRWLARVCAVSVRDTIKRLGKAFENFFRRVREGNNKPGYPRFQRRDRFNSIPFDNYGRGIWLVDGEGDRIAGDMLDDVCLRGHHLRLFGIGAVKVRLHRPIKGKIKTLTVKREGGHWYAVFSCDLGEVKIEPSDNQPIGIDVGLEHFLTTSDGEHVANPRHLKAALKDLRRAQRACTTQRKKDRPNARKKKKFGSNWRKAIRRVSRLHEEVANRRRDHHHKTALDLVRRFGVIAVEDLTVANMVRNHRLARAISDAGWAGFLAILTQKAEPAGVSVVKVDARGTSQECPKCGGAVIKTLSVRQHNCPHCGFSVHRDHAAAINILARAGVQARAEPAGHKHYSSAVPRRPSHAEDTTPKSARSAAARKPRHRTNNEKTLWDWQAQETSGA